MTQHETAEKNLNFFKITRAYRNAYEAFVEDEKYARDHTNAAMLQETSQKDIRKMIKTKEMMKMIEIISMKMKIIKDEFLNSVFAKRCMLSEIVFT